MIVIVMGVSGSGKTTVGKLLAKKIATPFFDADDFHPQTNIDKMSNGIPLNDDDRMPWLNALKTQIDIWNNRDGGVLACSALKESYRHLLNSAKAPINWVYLKGSFDLIHSRLEQRKAHYMGSAMLKSQFETLEPPEDAITVSIEQQPEDIVTEILEKLPL